MITAWRTAHPGQDLPDGQVFTQPWPAGPTDQRRDHTFYYRYSADRARRTSRASTNRSPRAQKAVAGATPVKRNRFVKLTGGDRSVNRALEAKARSLAGIKAYVTNLPPKIANSTLVIGSYHRLFQIEKSFRMSKHDLQARPISCRRRHEMGYADLWVMPTSGVRVQVSRLGAARRSA